MRRTKSPGAKRAFPGVPAAVTTERHAPRVLCSLEMFLSRLRSSIGHYSRKAPPGQPPPTQITSTTPASPACPGPALPTKASTRAASTAATSISSPPLTQSRKSTERTTIPGCGSTLSLLFLVFALNALLIIASARNAQSSSGNSLQPGFGASEKLRFCLCEGPVANLIDTVFAENLEPRIRRDCGSFPPLSHR